MRPLAPFPSARRARLAASAGLAAGALLAAVPSADAAGTLTIRGRGYGHGIGMSQWGAYGYALRGTDYATILAHYYTGTKLGETDPERLVRVLLRSSKDPISFSGAIQAGPRRLQPGTRYSIARAGSGQVELRGPSGQQIATYPDPLRVVGDGPVTLHGRAMNGLADGTYRGALEFRAGLFSGVDAINAVELEDYVRGVVSAESPASWPLQALKAQAVAARSYAITTGVGGRGYDQYPDTRSQMYRGVDAETKTTDAATAQTRGEVVTYDGEPVTTFFFSTSGGRTENIENSFIGSQPRPWLKSVDDPYDDRSPQHVWNPPVRMTLTDAQRKLKGFVKGSLRGIKVVKRGVSPRVVYADVLGSRGKTRVTGPQLRARLGLRDTWATFTTITTTKKPAPKPGGSTGGSTGGVSAKASRVAPRAVLAGHVRPGRRGARVVVERLAPRSRWVAVARATVARDESYRAAVTAPGSYRVRYGSLIGPVVFVR